jgi:uncharacterized OB-fold protein
MAAELRHPRPYADWETRTYWEGCGRGELLLQRCRACRTVQHRPRALCASCLSDDIEHFAASGRGTVHTFTVTHQNQLPGFREACPYVLAYVELEEGPRLLSNVVGCEPDAVTIGMPVRVEFAAPAEAAEGFAVPRFRPE